MDSPPATAVDRAALEAKVRELEQKYAGTIVPLPDDWKSVSRRLRNSALVVGSDASGAEVPAVPPAWPAVDAVTLSSVSPRELKLVINEFSAAATAL